MRTRASLVRAPAEPEHLNEPKKYSGAKDVSSKGRRSSEALLDTPTAGPSLASPDGVVDYQILSLPTAMPHKRKSRLSKASQLKTESGIGALTPECLDVIFGHVHDLTDTAFCRNVLPLVCKQWCRVLRGPSKAWKVTFGAIAAFKDMSLNLLPPLDLRS